MTDLLLIHPSAREAIYQGLADDFAAVEPPLWCRIIAGYVRDRGYSVAIIDAEADNLTPLEVAKRAEELKPSLIAIVAHGHQPSASTQQMEGAKAIIDALVDVIPATRTLLLGGHVSALPEQSLRETQAIYACKGEGPQTIIALLEGQNYRTILGLVWQGDGVNVNAPAPLIEDLAADYHGHTWDLLPMQKYRAHNWQCFDDLSKRQPYAAIYTSLGCPYKCSFCCINAPFDSNRYRVRNPQQVADEMLFLQYRHGVHTFKIVDEMFVLNDRHVKAVCEAIIAHKLGDYSNIWAYARIDTVKSDEQLDLLRRAGVRWLALGIESGSKHVRDGAVKALKHDDISYTVARIKSAGINVIGNFIFGLPDDDDTTMCETLNLALSLKCEFANFYSAMAYPGSRLHAEAKAPELPKTWSGYSQHSYDCTPLPTQYLSARDVLAFRDAAFRRYFTDRSYLQMVGMKFGAATRAHVEAMAARPLARELLGDPAPKR